jgi:hypothetical protein
MCDARGGGRAGRDAERGARAADVRVNARRRDAQLQRDLFGRPSSRDRGEDLTLPLGELPDGVAALDDPAREGVSGDEAEDHRAGASSVHSQV